MFVDCKERRCGRHVNGVRSDPRTIRPFSHRPLNLVKTSPGASGFETRGTRPDGGNHDVNSSLDGACRTVVRRSRPGQPTRWPWQPSTPLRESGTTWSSARPWTISFRSSMKTGCLTDRGSAHETGRPRYGNPRVIDRSSIAAGRPGMPAVGARPFRSLVHGLSSRGCNPRSANDSGGRRGRRRLDRQEECPSSFPFPRD